MTDSPPPGEFTGTARLFPLPNIVMFPTVVQGLHVFEPRYRQLVKDALAGDRFVAIALLKPGWEDDYENAPAIEPVACLGRVTWHEKLADGRYNLRLRGAARCAFRGALRPIASIGSRGRGNRRGPPPDECSRNCGKSWRTRYSPVSRRMGPRDNSRNSSTVRCR